MDKLEKSIKDINIFYKKQIKLIKTFPGAIEGLYKFYEDKGATFGPIGIYFLTYLTVENKILKSKFNNMEWNTFSREWISGN